MHVPGINESMVHVIIIVIISISTAALHIYPLLQLQYLS